MIFGGDFISYANFCAFNRNLLKTFHDKTCKEVTNQLANIWHLYCFDSPAVSLNVKPLPNSFSAPQAVTAKRFLETTWSRTARLFGVGVFSQTCRVAFRLDHHSLISPRSTAHLPTLTRDRLCNIARCGELSVGMLKFWRPATSLFRPDTLVWFDILFVRRDTFRKLDMMDTDWKTVKTMFGGWSRPGWGF